MLKIGIFIIGLSMLSSTASAAWWDCKSSVSGKGIFGWSYTGEVEEEITASNRSSAINKAAEPGFHFILKTFGSSEYVCGIDRTTENGKPCKYRFTGSVKCERQ